MFLVPQLIPFIVPDPLWVAAEGGRGYILERRIFDRALAERAAQAGAEVRGKTAVTGLLVQDGPGKPGAGGPSLEVRGVRIRRGVFFPARERWR